MTDGNVCFQYTDEGTTEEGVPNRPYAVFELQTRNGEWYKISAIVDTGADITSCPRTVCEIIGKELREGQEVPMTSATGVRFSLFMHKVKARLRKGDLISKEFIMTVGFSEREDFPYLLGRKDVLDHFNIKFAKDDVWFLEE